MQFDLLLYITEHVQSLLNIRLKFNSIGSNLFNMASQSIVFLAQFIGGGQPGATGIATMKVVRVNKAGNKVVLMVEDGRYSYAANAEGGRQIRGRNTRWHYDGRTHFARGIFLIYSFVIFISFYLYTDNQ